MIQSMFVYGTLKRGQCREPLWPVRPITIRDAWIHGTLFGRHDYPAMVVGEDRVVGELWSFRADEMASVTKAIDRVEGTNQPGQRDLYLRVTVHARGFDDDRLLEQAFAYQYAIHPEAHGFLKLDPDADGWVRWPQSGSA